MHYLGNLVGPYRLVVPLATGAAALAALAARAARHRSRRVLVAALAPVAGGILHGLYIVRVGGDFMHGRLLLPALFGCLTPVLVVPVRRWTIGAAVAITAAWSALCAAAFSSPGPGNGIVDERAFWEAGAGGHQLVRVGDYAMFPHYKQGRLVRVRLDQGGSGFAVRRDPRFSDYAFLPFQSQAPARVGIEEAHVGVVGMVAGPDAYVLDVLGLADPMAARIHLATRLRPGHEKHLDRAWIWARLVAADAPSIPTGPTPEAVATANQALRCPPLHRLMVAVRAPLTPGRFVHNVVDSLALHRLRFDNDPVPARQQLCR
jgi:arabinofuranosyltransferase